MPPEAQNSSDSSDLKALREENGRLYSVLEANKMLSSSLDLGLVLDGLMERAKEVTDAEASSLMLLDEEKDELFFHTVKGEKSEAIKKIRLRMGEGIAGWVAQHGEPVLVEDAANDPRFSNRADQASSFVTRTMMCVPLQLKRRVIGTVQVLNKGNNQSFHGGDLKIFSILANQAAIAIENARLHEMATVDGMTGLYIKNYFMARLSEEYRRARLQNRPLALLMSDIDFFKKVNDRFGHPGGDRALVELASVIKETVHRLDSDDIAGRYGGEEFCVLLPDSDQSRALEVGELIRKNIESRPIPIGNEEAHITISIGISCLPAHSDYVTDTEDLIKLADEALYICKDQGRNCVALYEERA
ncbi:MAG: sensor domain-containing diguanylate cyclase [Spirochaetales bacterium]|nr:sensor domain-containing diguanylate cyclase [Leptospiraceae bacterium]MCP5480601.1 sensor domain-containing diguanylate cyclase [Spirochaetales bacterium]MCP5483951.1 sensor domain-containing diguanylate cyclase [Spirochaetales bacterium]